MKRLILSLSLTLAALTAVPNLASAVIIVDQQVQNGVATFFPGQSLTTPSGGPWDNLTFNWMDGFGTPTAVGDLFLLTQTYAGTPAALSNATPGFLAQSTSIVGGQYVFAPTVSVLPNTQYFFFSNASQSLSGTSADVFAGGVASLAASAASNFGVLVPSRDARFTFQGQDQAAAVPEPSTFALFGLVLALGVGCYAFRRRQLVPA